jgi:hypothetical protein
MACLSLVGRVDDVSSAKSLPPTEYDGHPTRSLLSKPEDVAVLAVTPAHAGEFLGTNIFVATTVTTAAMLN